MKASATALDVLSVIIREEQECEYIRLLLTREHGVIGNVIGKAVLIDDGTPDRTDLETSVNGFDFTCDEKQKVIERT
jgi:hypothetical protein